MAEKKAKTERRSLKKVEAYQHVFNSPSGRLVLHDLMQAHGVLAAHPSVPEEMMLKEGERLVVLRILAFLKVNPKDLLERIEEHEAEME